MMSECTRRCQEAQNKCIRSFHASENDGAANIGANTDPSVPKKIDVLDLSLEAILNEMLMHCEEKMEYGSKKMEHKPLLTSQQILKICSGKALDISGEKLDELVMTIADVIDNKYSWKSPHDGLLEITQIRENVKNKLTAHESNEASILNKKLTSIFTKPFNASIAARRPPKFADRQLFFYVQIFNVNNIDTVNQVCALLISIFCNFW